MMQRDVDADLLEDDFSLLDGHVVWIKSLWPRFLKSTALEVLSLRLVAG
jgi:hypothetical protein